MAFQTQIYDFLDMMAAETGASENTLSAYKSDLQQFEVWCAEKRPEVLTADDIAAYIQELGRRNYAPKSVARKLSALKDFDTSIRYSVPSLYDISTSLSSGEKLKDFTTISSFCLVLI